MKRFLLTTLMLALFTSASFLTVSGQTCNPPTGIQIGNITHNSAVVNFIPAPGAQFTYLHYREIGMTNWIMVSANQTVYTLSNLADSTQYELELRSYCGSNMYSSWTPALTFTTSGSNGQCPPPVAITIAGTSNTTATLTWTPVPGAVYYYIYYKPATTNVWTYITSSGTLITLSNLQPATTFDVKIRSYCATYGQGGFSPVSNFTTGNAASPCNPPVNIAVNNITSNAATLSWPITIGALYYSIQYRETGTTAWLSGSSTTTQYSFYGLSDSTQYEFQLRCNCGTNSLGPWSQIGTFTTLSAGGTCPPPTGITVTGISSNSATFSWIPSAGVTTYYIYYKPSNATNWTYTVSSGTSVTFFNLAISTQYDYRIRSYCPTFGLGAYSPTGTFSTNNNPNPCLPPTNITVSNITASNANISWTTVPGVMYYQIQYRLAGTASWLMGSSSQSGYTLSNLLDSTTYEFQVRSNCGSSNISLGGWSPVHTFTTLAAGNACPPPANIQILNVTQHSATIQWVPLPGVLYYHVYYKKSADNTWAFITSGAPTFPLYNLTDSTQYDVRIRSYCQVTGFGAFSPVINFTTTYQSNTCLPPAGITVSNITASSATLTWPAVPGSAFYNWQYRQVGTVAWYSMSSSTTTLTFSGLIDSATYEFQGRSYCGPGAYSPWSPILTLTTLPGLLLCPPPSGITITGVGNSWVTLAWNPMPGTSIYYVYYKKSTSPGWITTTTTTPGKSLFNLADTTQYDYKIRSYCSGSGLGASSPTGTFITTNTPTPCTSPSGFTVTNITSFTAKVNWLAIPGVMHYQLHYRETGTLPWMTLSAMTPSATLYNLFDSTTYEFEARSFCGSNNLGSWSATGSFTTLAASGSCAPPTGNVISLVSNSTAQITWIAVPGVTYYQVYYRKTNASGWLYRSTNTAQINLTFLSDTTAYHYRIRSYCTNGGYSTFSPIDSFITLSASSFICQAPTGVTVTNITSHSAKVSWNVAPGAYYYRIRYRIAGTPNWMLSYTTIAERILYTLVDSATYETEVSTHCGYGVFSPWTPTLAFNTPDDPNTLIPKMMNQVDADYEDQNPAITAGVSQTDLSVGFTIYPNPASEVFYIRTNNPSIRNVLIYNIQGVLIHTYAYLPAAGYPLDNLAPGMYFLRVSTEEQVSPSGKLLVQ